jgi:hypothetical protein
LRFLICPRCKRRAKREGGGVSIFKTKKPPRHDSETEQDPRADLSQIHDTKSNIQSSALVKVSIHQDCPTWLSPHVDGTRHERHRLIGNPFDKARSNPWSVVRKHNQEIIGSSTSSTPQEGPCIPIIDTPTPASATSLSRRMTGLQDLEGAAELHVGLGSSPAWLVEDDATGSTNPSSSMQGGDGGPEDLVRSTTPPGRRGGRKVREMERRTKDCVGVRERHGHWYAEWEQRWYEQGFEPEGARRGQYWFLEESFERREASTRCIHDRGDRP